MQDYLDKTKWESLTSEFELSEAEIDWCQQIRLHPHPAWFRPP